MHHDHPGMHHDHMSAAVATATTEDPAAILAPLFTGTSDVLQAAADVHAGHHAGHHGGSGTGMEHMMPMAVSISLQFYSFLIKSLYLF